MESNLEYFQKMFLSGILENKMPEELLSFIKPAGSLSTHQVIEVYQNDYYARLGEALGLNYEACWFALGDSAFFELSEQFIKKYPSDLKNLTFYGERFPDFMARTIDRDLPFLPFLAEFEKSFWRIFHGPYRMIDRLDISKLGDAFFQQQFTFDTSVKLFSWNYHLFDLWQKRKGDEGELSLDDIEGAQHVVIYKEQDEVQVVTLSNEFNFLLTALVDGLTIEESLAALQDNTGLEAELMTPKSWSSFFIILSNILCK